MKLEQLANFQSELTFLVKWSPDVYFDLRLNKRLSKQSGRRWLETLIITSL